MATIKDTKRDKFKHSATAMEKNRGKPKKGGAGKANWGKPGDELYGHALHPNDPLYDSLEETEILYMEVHAHPAETVQRNFTASIEQMTKFKGAIRSAVAEFLTSFDQAEFARCVDELNQPLYHQEIPKILIVAALDRSDEAQKRASALLEHLVKAQLLTPVQIENGFRHVFSRFPDLLLDVPNAEKLLKQFVLRAVNGKLLSEKLANELCDNAAKITDGDQVRKAKTKSAEIVAEYFDSQDLAETERCIVEMKSPHFHHEIVKQAISCSMDRASRERELASFLIESLTGTTISHAEVEKGFETLLQRVEDIYNDVPHVLEYLSCFIARAIVDEALPPIFLARVNLLPSDMGSQVVKQAGVLLHEKHAAARLSHVWGPGDGRSVPQLKRAVRELVLEYFESGDLAEAKTCVKELNANYFHHEIIDKIIILTLDKTERERKMASELINSLVSEGIVSRNQLRMGVERVAKDIPDLQLDCPDAPKVFAELRKTLPEQ